ncbi:MAG: DUF971 domain-containing protein [Planctomycetota bacterium]|nr:DUF971 domain-containing protein [Planctomycetota bacterium]
MSRDSSFTPTDIKADRPNGRFEIAWSDGRSDGIPFRAMRCDCPCAACVSEFTGERLLDPAKVPEAIEPTAVELAGNYALKVRWSDGHDTGLYTWSHLRRLGDDAPAA